MKTQRHVWNVTLAGCLMDTMDQCEKKKTKTRNERAGKKQPTSTKQKSYKLIALDTINLSLVLTFIKLSLDLADFQPACLSRNSPETSAAFDAIAPPFLRL